MAQRGWQYKGPRPGDQFSWVTRPGVLRSPLSIDIPATHNPLNISQVLTNIGKNMPVVSSIISNSWLPRTAHTLEPVRKALYPVAHGAVMQAREESKELVDKIRKAEDKVVSTFGGGKKSPEAEKKARAPVYALWNQYRAVQKRLAEYEKIRVRLEHKKRKPKPLDEEAEAQGAGEQIAQEGWIVGCNRRGRAARLCRACDKKGE